MKSPINKQVFLFFLLLVFTAGCGNKPPRDNRVLAKINNYEMTVSDLQDEARMAHKPKEELLREFISKKVLIQEALKLNFDKDKAFMKEIEKYWEQALLKLLFKVKSEELLRAIRVNDDEVRQAYAKMKKRVFAQFFVLTDKAAAEELSQAGANLNEKKNGLKSFITQETTDWWGWGDLPRGIEDILFSLKPGQVSEAFSYLDNWAVVKVLKEENVAVEPIAKMMPFIKEELLKQKKSEVLDNWIESITKKARVSVDEKLLREIKIE
ncbi:MAG: peptidylprolyl isomerase [Candidatus Omnitrophica bacterium]|nr:peptidylprolyl isomerase [Candidatus Omnitrophota bacterium]